MRRIHLMIALLGTTAISAQAIGAPGHGGSHATPGHGGSHATPGHGGSHATPGHGGSHGIPIHHPRIYGTPGVVVPGASIVERAPEVAQEWGMKLTDVAPKGVAARADLHVGDIIMMAGGVRTQSFEDLAAALAAANGPIEIVFINAENNQQEKMQIVPVNGKIGVATLAVVVE
jgi:membrane-associated protease RseP (regulator of RpoE activity)